MKAKYMETAHREMVRVALETAGPSKGQKENA